MSPNWDENRTRAILRKTTQIVLGKTLTFSLDSLRFSRRRVTYPRPWHPQVLAIKRVPPRELEAAGTAASRESSPRPLCRVSDDFSSCGHRDAAKIVTAGSPCDRIIAGGTLNCTATRPKSFGPRGRYRHLRNAVLGSRRLHRHGVFVTSERSSKKRLADRDTRNFLIPNCRTVGKQCNPPEDESPARGAHRIAMTQAGEAPYANGEAPYANGEGGQPFAL